MSETTDAVIGVIASGFIEPSLGNLPAVLEAEMTTVYPFVGDPSFVDLETQYSTDADEIKSLPGATAAYARKTSGKFSRVMRAGVESITDIMAVATNNVNTSAASAAVDEVQTLDVTGITAGAFKLKDRKSGLTTAELQFDVSAAAFDTALEAVVGTGNVAVTLLGSVYTMTFGGALAATDYPELELIVTVEPTGGVFDLQTTQEGQAAGRYTQTIREPSICELNPPSMSYAEAARCNGVAGSFKKYTGVVPAAASLEISNDDLLNFSVDFLTCGQELDGSAFSVPANDSPITKLTGAQVQVWLGDSFTAPFLVGADELVKVAVKWNFDPQIPVRINNLPTISEFQRPKGGMSIDLSATFKGGKSSRFYGMADLCRYGYQPKMRIFINPHSTPQGWLQLDFNALHVEKAMVKPSGREQQTEMTFMALSNATDVGRFTLTTVTAIDAYNQLTA